MTPDEVQILYDLIKENRRLITINLILTAAIIGEKAIQVLFS